MLGRPCTAIINENRTKTYLIKFHLLCISGNQGLNLDFRVNLQIQIWNPQIQILKYLRSNPVIKQGLLLEGPVFESKTRFIIVIPYLYVSSKQG